MTPELTPSSPAYTAQPEPPHARTHSTAAASSLLPNIRAPSLDDDATAVVSLPCRLELSSLPFSALRSSPLARPRLPVLARIPEAPAAFRAIILNPAQASFVGHKF
ncbi:unnamed protein product [Laminaria digitata]